MKCRVKGWLDLRHLSDARPISMSTLRGINNGPCLDSTEPFHLLLCPACGWGACKVIKILARHRKQFCYLFRGSKSKTGGRFQME